MVIHRIAKPLHVGQTRCFFARMASLLFPDQVRRVSAVAMAMQPPRESESQGGEAPVHVAFSHRPATLVLIGFHMHATTTQTSASRGTKASPGWHCVSAPSLQYLPSQLGRSLELTCVRSETSQRKE